jgi:hypothetical protein
MTFELAHVETGKVRVPPSRSCATMLDFAIVERPLSSSYARRMWARGRQQ